MVVCVEGTTVIGKVTFVFVTLGEITAIGIVGTPISISGNTTVDTFVDGKGATSVFTPEGRFGVVIIDLVPT